MTIAWTTADHVTEIADGVLRHFPPGFDGRPFPGFAETPAGQPVAVPEAPEVPPIGVAPSHPESLGAVVPEFADWGSTPLVRIAATQFAQVMGLGEVCGPLVHVNRTIVGDPADCFGYDTRHDSLYQAHPWLVAVRPDGSAFGVLVETTWRFEARIAHRATFSLQGPPAAVVTVESDDLLGVTERLADLTGKMPLPPRWALGYHQCRYSYAPASRVREVAAELRARHLPCDVLWVDIDYMDGYRVFTFDPDGFANPAELNADLHRDGFRTAWMIDPGIKAEPGYSVYDEAVDGDHLVTAPDGSPASGMVWPGETVFPDFTRERTRRWWASLYGPFMSTGIDAVWNDMNEPSTLEDCPGQRLAPTIRHDADEDLGGPGDHGRYRNVYGMQMTRASREGIQAARPEARPFLLTRSTFLGGHRYAATWTGDNVSSWEHLAWSIPMVLNLGLSGQPMAGPDIGGFAGDCTGELLARWMGIGCLLPFARNHAMKATADQEPWAFGPEVEATCRRALERRMRLLPYLYTVAEQAARTGRPIARPALTADPGDGRLHGVDTAFMLGDDLYVRCDVSPDRRGPWAPIPEGWRRIHVLAAADDDRDPDLPELYLRPGRAVPLGPVMQWSDQTAVDDLELVAAPDRHGAARAELYEDDGASLSHRTGAFRRTRLEVHPDGLTREVVAGSWPAGTWDVRVRWV